MKEVLFARCTLQTICPRTDYQFLSHSRVQITNLKNVQADGTSRDVHVRMVAWRVKLDRRRYIRVIRGKGYGNLETESGINLLQVK
jgi:hypothetical protein